MGELEDIQRLRDDVADLYEQTRAVQQRLTRLEERSDNRDEKIEELKQALKDLHEQIKTMECAIESRLAQISDSVQIIANAPAQRIASRWDQLLMGGALVILTAALTYFIAGGKP